MSIKTFRKKLLTAAILSTRHTSAEAVSLIAVEPSARLISVIDAHKAARFIEGRNTQEVLDFNLFLSPRDVWTRPNDAAKQTEPSQLFGFRVQANTALDNCVFAVPSDRETSSLKSPEQFAIITGIKGTP